MMLRYAADRNDRHVNVKPSAKRHRHSIVAIRAASAMQSAPPPSRGGGRASQGPVSGRIDAEVYSAVRSGASSARHDVDDRSLLLGTALGLGLVERFFDGEGDLLDGE